MRLIVVNVNTSATISAAIHGQATKHAASTTSVETITPYFGPRAVEDGFDTQLSAVAVMDRVAAVDGDFDAVIEAGFGEHARTGLQELLDVPVIGITDAAVLIAILLGRKFSIITTVARAVDEIEDRLRVAQLAGRCASIRATELGVLQIEQEPRRAMEAIANQAQRAVNEDGADVICLGCAGMVGLEEHVAGTVPVPVVDGVTAAVKLAEALHTLGLRPRGRAKKDAATETPYWPLHRYLDGHAEAPAPRAVPIDRP